MKQPGDNNLEGNLSKIDKEESFLTKQKKKLLL